jgi:hypothetical protein
MAACAQALAELNGLSKSNITQIAQKVRQSEQKAQAAGKSRGGGGGGSSGGSENEVPKWKKESSALREAMKAVRAYRMEQQQAKATSGMTTTTRATPGRR